MVYSFIIMPRNTVNNSGRIDNSFSKELIILFILINFGIWAIIGYMYLLAYLQANFIEIATQGLNFAISLPLIAVGLGYLSKSYSKVNIIKLYNFAILIAAVHLFMDILHFPNLNWLNRTKV